MRALTILMTGILLGVCSSPVPAEPARDDGRTGTIASYEKAISEAKDGKEEALLRKKLGDYYASQEDYKRAAEEYMKAFSLSASAFSKQDRLEMAVRLSWADRLDDAVRMLRSILAEDPKDRRVRTELAKVLSWSDKPSEAGEEADIVLKEYPDDQQALIVKANVLRWRGDNRASIPVYEKALAQGESFDARIGLAYAKLDEGKKKDAQEIAKKLDPLSPAQVRERAKFSDALCSVETWHLGIPFSHYEDSDKNTVNRTALVSGFRTAWGEMEVAYRMTDAKDPLRHENAEDILASAHAKQGEFRASLEAGITMAEGGSMPIGRANVNKDMSWGSASVSASRDVLTDTAQLIDNRVVRASGTLSATETASPRLSFTEQFTHSGYSDSNSADDLSLIAKYIVTPALPKITAGYRFRYLNFRRQSGSGYFDPEDFTSHQIFLSFYAERNGFYAYLQPSGGYQSFSRYGESTNETFYSISASAGWTMKKCTAFELSGEGGNYAGGSVSGYNYYQIGLRLTAYF